MNKILNNLPNKFGYFGKYGGQILPNGLKPIFDDIYNEYKKIKKDKNFIEEYKYLLKNYVGRPSPLYFAKNLTEKIGGAKIYLKREDLNHTGAHKINHTLGEALLAKRIGKTKLLAETGAGQHGVALATAAAIVGIDCEIHMGEIDIKKQYPNVMRMKLLGAKVINVKSGGKCLKDAVDSAFKSFLKDPKNIFFGIGSVVGPHPFPKIVMDFQSIVGKEAKKQILQQEKRLPDYLVACVGGGSNAIGLFHKFLNEDSVKIIGVEPAGKNFLPGNHAATLKIGTPGYIHGMFTYLLQDKNHNPLPVHSIASGLDYPGVGPIHSYLKDIKRIEYVTANNKEALCAFKTLTKIEGIIPALESSHAIAYGIKLAKKLDKEKIIIINLSGRGDKDLDYVTKILK
ncbi:MAG: tryptophan synthase subunit beta [Patescibacteria group bacterium]|nr:tryptophan synthase subunit beta [Patescibacteria group bacterium]